MTRAPRAVFAVFPVFVLFALVAGILGYTGCSKDKKTTSPTPDRPVINSIQPDTVVAGTTAWVRGDRFGSSHGSSQLLFGSRNAQSLQWTATKILAVVPDDVTAGNLTAIVGGVMSDPRSYKVANKAPSIERIDPTSGEVGATIRIEGRRFGVDKDESQVFFGALEATTASWGDTVLQATVPAGAQSDTVHVRARNLDSNGAPFTLIAETPPVIESVEPDSALPGTDIKIHGRNFTGTSSGGVVRIGGAPATISSWSDSLIEAGVGQDAVAGDQHVQVTVGGLSSNSFPFKVLQASVPVVISRLEPARTTVSDIITIWGTGFRSATIEPIVTFQGASGRIPTTVTVAEATSISAWVPPGAVDGPVIVQFGDQISEAVPFSVAPRRILFTTDLHPLFETKGCLGCHSGSAPSGGLNVETKANLLHGNSDHGPVVILRNGPGSIIVKKVGPNPPFGERMPRGCTTCLSDEEILLISDWIDQAGDN